MTSEEMDREPRPGRTARGCTPLRKTVASRERRAAAPRPPARPQHPRPPPRQVGRSPGRLRRRRQELRQLRLPRRHDRRRRQLHPRGPPRHRLGPRGPRRLADGQVGHRLPHRARHRSRDAGAGPAGRRRQVGVGALIRSAPPDHAIEQLERHLQGSLSRAHSPRAPRRPAPCLPSPSSP